MTVTQDSSDEAGDILIYDTTNWVSWLSPSSYEARRSWTDGLNFGGTSDWAVDLNQTFSNNGTGSEESSGYDDNSDFALCDYTLTFNSLDDLSAASGSLRSDCIAAYTMQVLIDMLNTAYANYTDVNNGYDDMFGYYVTYIEDLVPEILKAGFMFNITDNQHWDTIGFLPDLGYGMNCEETPPSDLRTHFLHLFTKSLLIHTTQISIASCPPAMAAQSRVAKLILVTAMSFPCGMGIPCSCLSILTAIMPVWHKPASPQTGLYSATSSSKVILSQPTAVKKDSIILLTFQ